MGSEAGGGAGCEAATALPGSNEVKSLSRESRSKSGSAGLGGSGIYNVQK